MFKIKNSILFFFLFLFSIASANSPQMRCVSVLPNGNVDLSWSKPVVSTGTFDSYFIFTSNNYNGPYTLVTTIANVNQTTYTHTTVNANLARVYYFIQTQYNLGGLNSFPAIDTVSTIKLTVTNPTNGTAILNWNPVKTPNIHTSSGVYNVFVEYPQGNWSLIGSTTALKHTDSIFVCNSQLNYKVEISDSTGCKSISSVDGGIFQNIIVPQIPDFDTLSVNNNNDALMSWNVNSSKDVSAYVIYQYNGTAWVPIDTVYGINTTSFTYLLSNPDQASEQYRLAALDSCGNISPLGPIKSTIFLTATANICNRSAILSWTNYGKIGLNLKGYRVYLSTNGQNGPYVLEATVSANTLTYTKAGLPPNTTYYFKVEAFDSLKTKTASSNRLSFFSVAPIPPTFTYVRKASVSAPNTVKITCHVDVAASSKAYKIMKSTTGITGSYTQIGLIPVSGISPINFTDTKVNTDKNNYYYKVINVDSCGYDGAESNIGKTILLNAISNSDNLSNELTWNDYENWDGSVDSYNIYRGVDGVFDPVPIANVPFSGVGINKYTDDITPFITGEGVFNYYIEAIEGAGNIYSFVDTSYSNVAEAYQDAKVFIPNAFKIRGTNSIFIPVMTYIDVQEYDFTIFNRWGEVVFSTKNVTEGWDGRYSGKQALGGVYVYKLKFKTSRGEYIERLGSVLLIK